MKTVKFLTVLLVFIGLYINNYGQDSCKVLIPEISDKYLGKCKKGLAHGQGKAEGIDSYTGRFVKGLPDGYGIYTWSDGNVYDGMWEKGSRNGIGTYTFKVNGNDSIMSGVWDMNLYKGPKPKAPEVKYSRGVTRQSFTKLGGFENRIEIRIMRGGGTNPAVYGLTISSSSGRLNGLYLEEINYPVKVRVNYTTVTTFATAQYPVVFDFEITEPGDWLVIINN